MEEDFHGLPEDEVAVGFLVVFKKRWREFGKIIQIDCVIFRIQRLLLVFEFVTEVDWSENANGKIQNV